MSTRDEDKQWFDAKFPPESVSRDDEREYVLRRFYDNAVMVTMTFLDDGKTADLFVPASHRAAVAAALCPPAPTRDEIENAIRDALNEAYSLGGAWECSCSSSETAGIEADLAAITPRLLALLAPPAPGEVTERDAMLALAVALEAGDPNADGRAAPYREQASHLLDRLRGQGYRLAALAAAAAPEQSR